MKLKNCRNPYNIATQYVQEHPDDAVSQLKKT